MLAGGQPPGLYEGPGPGERRQGWQRHALATFILFSESATFYDSSAPALLRSQSGPQAGAWLSAMPADPGAVLTPEAMQLALRRRLRLPLPLTYRRCGDGTGHGCGAAIDAFGDHYATCTRTGLPARRAVVLEQAWVRVAREAVGPEGRVVPQQWLARTAATQKRARHTGDRWDK